ncbi:uncharacterized protein LOC117175999 isoform X2 [Belonocnema kinseyi]|uniref:uncharacterized protein LOC117175999 isoform X2 n=1 Tax=Belonocnema kinseyi TaxID=2817044 RepID=UPI00143DCAF1|nr:uncharacterized protein LOC117175999 isoform X2 [Belonocnema kinseyi]
MVLQKETIGVEDSSAYNNYDTDTKVEKAFDDHSESCQTVFPPEKQTHTSLELDDNVNYGHHSTRDNSPHELHMSPELDDNGNVGENSSQSLDRRTNDRRSSAEEDLRIPDENIFGPLNSKKTNKNEFIRFGQKLCSRAAVEQSNRSCVARYVGELASIVFTKAELATSSLTGAQSNTNKDKNRPPPKKLDTHRVTAIKKLTVKIFSDTADNKKAFNTAIQTKCSNARGLARKLLDTISQ